jgi:tetratricopeptide (TPR) repeat protein
MSAPGSENRPAENICAPESIDAAERLRALEVEREQAIAEAKMERRRRRRSLAALLALFVVVLVAGGFSVWRYFHIRSVQSEEMARRAATEQDIQHILDDVRARIQAASDSDNPEQDAEGLQPAFAQLERAEMLLHCGGINEELQQDVVRTRDILGRVHRDLVTIAGLDRIRLDFIDARVRRISTKSIAGRYAAAFAALGVEPGGDRAMTSSSRLRAHHQRERLLAAISNWRVIEPDERKKNALAYLLRITESKDAYRPRLRDAMIRRDHALVTRLLKSPELLKQPSIYLCRLSVVLRSINLDEQAIEVLRIGLDRAPGDFWLNTEMGGIWLHRQPNGPATAREYFKAAVAIRPKCAEANYLLGVALQRMGDFDEATTALSRAIEHDAQFYDAHLQLCAALVERKDIDAAIEHGRQAVALAPDNPATANGLALAFLARGNNFDAADLYRKALAADGDFVPALLGLGGLLLDEGAVVEAERLLKRALDLAPDKYEALNQYGLLLQARGDLGGAARIFRKAMDANKEDPAACVFLGVVRKAQGERAEAIRWFQAGIERNSKYAPAYVELGLDHIERGEIANAVRILLQAVDCDARSAKAQFHLGRAYRRADDLSSSLAAFRLAAELRPNWIEAQFCRGVTAFKLGMFAESVEALDRAARLCPISNPLIGLIHLYLHRARKQVVAPERQSFWVLHEHQM